MYKMVLSPNVYNGFTTKWKWYKMVISPNVYNGVITNLTIWTVWKESFVISRYKYCIQSILSMKFVLNTSFTTPNKYWKIKTHLLTNLYCNS